MFHSGGGCHMAAPATLRHDARGDYPGLERKMYGYGVGLTAALTALVRSDVRHLVGLAHTVLLGVRVLFGKSAERRADHYPTELARIELRGLVAGPFAYLRSLLTRPRTGAR